MYTRRLDRLALHVRMDRSEKLADHDSPIDEVAEFITGFFIDRNPTTKIAAADLLPQDYFAAELIDSFGTIEMIGIIEDKFGINFDFEDFENPDFKIVEGLIGVIRSKLS